MVTISYDYNQKICTETGKENCHSFELTCHYASEDRGLIHGKGYVRTSYDNVDAYVKGIVINPEDEKIEKVWKPTLGFLAHDVMSLMDFLKYKKTRLVIIYQIYVDPKHRDLGIARCMIENITDRFQDAVIVTRAGVLQKEYPNEPEFKKFNEIISDVSSFLNYNGFRSINTYCHLENSNAFLYINKTAKPLIRWFNEFEWYGPIDANPATDWENNKRNYQE